MHETICSGVMSATSFQTGRALRLEDDVRRRVVGVRVHGVGAGERARRRHADIAHVEACDGDRHSILCAYCDEWWDCMALCADARRNVNSNGVYVARY